MSQKNAGCAVSARKVGLCYRDNALRKKIQARHSRNFEEALCGKIKPTSHGGKKISEKNNPA